LQHGAWHKINSPGWFPGLSSNSAVWVELADSAATGAKGGPLSAWTAPQTMACTAAALEGAGVRDAGVRDAGDRLHKAVAAIKLSVAVPSAVDRIQPFRTMGDITL
jgi:hypothetical protein